jgi:hypothetical protein
MCTGVNDSLTYVRTAVGDDVGRSTLVVGYICQKACPVSSYHIDSKIALENEYEL